MNGEKATPEKIKKDTEELKSKLLRSYSSVVNTAIKNFVESEKKNKTKGKIIAGAKLWISTDCINCIS